MAAVCLLLCACSCVCLCVLECVLLFSFICVFVFVLARVFVYVWDLAVVRACVKVYVHRATCLFVRFWRVRACVCVGATAWLQCCMLWLLRLHIVFWLVHSVHDRALTFSSLTFYNQQFDSYDMLNNMPTDQKWTYLFLQLMQDT